MVLNLTALAVESLALPISKFALGAVSVAGLAAIRRQSGGLKCQDSRRLEDKTFILVGCWSGAGLSLVTELAWAGAQLVLVHPSPLSPSVVQLLLVLRHSTANERIYAEECDMADLGSIRRFAKQWTAQGRGGMVNELEARVEAVVFCDGDGSELPCAGLGVDKELRSGLGGPSTEAVDSPVEAHHLSLVLARHALLQLLLPTLLRSSVDSPVRIISQVSPFYAAGASLLSSPALDFDYTSTPYPTYSPWLAEARASLASVIILREFQRRLDLGPSRANGAAGLVVLLPCGGFTRQWARRTLRAEWFSPTFSLLGYVAWLALLPLLWLFLRSAAEASQELVRCCMGDVRGVPTTKDVVDESEAKAEEVAEGESRKVKRVDVEAPRTKLRRGALYRDGQEIQ